jgi:hypothetical protein
MITFKSAYAPPSQAAPGFVSVLTVLSLGIALMIIMIMMYKETIQTQNNQKYDLLRNDYQQREEAFFTALTNIVPNKAMRGMMDGASAETDLDWTSIFDDALTQSNSHKAISATEGTALGLSSHRSGNTADATLTPSSIIQSVFQSGGLISSGTNSVGSSSRSYPPLLSCDATLKSDDQTYPIISQGKSDGVNALYGKIPAPKLNFSYQKEDEFIAKHNWWTFTVSFDDQNSDVTHLARASKQYLVSLYEVPAQLAINSASFTNFGQHGGEDGADGENWGANITTTGGVSAGAVIAKGSFTSTDGIASRQGIELADASNPLASDNTARNQELYEDGKASSYSSSSDGGHVAFIPILPVLGSSITSGSDFDLYDAYLKELTTWTAAGSDPKTRPINKLFYTRTLPVKFEETGTNTLSTSSTAWKYYSRGANQCKMILIDDYDPGDPTKTSEFYVDIEDNDNHLGMDLIVIDSKQVFTAAGEDLEVNLGNLIDYLSSLSIDMSSINSLCVNTTRERVIFRNAKYLTLPDDTGFTAGFSIVTNKKLVLDEDINLSSLPLSMYAPQARYGNNVRDLDIAKFKIEVDGGLGSLAERTKGDDAVNPADLKTDFTVESETKTTRPALSATLSSITELDDLPPINMMNWMVIVREIRE